MPCCQAMSSAPSPFRAWFDAVRAFMRLRPDIQFGGLACFGRYIQQRVYCALADFAVCHVDYAVASIPLFLTMVSNALTPRRSALTPAPKPKCYFFLR